MTATDIRITKADRDQARELGVQASAVAQIRSEHGRDKVREMLELPEEAAPEPPKVETVVPAFANLKILNRCPNPIWVRCCSPLGVAVNVQVRRNNRLRPGMLLQCSGSGDQWKCVHAGLAPL